MSRGGRGLALVERAARVGAVVFSCRLIFELGRISGYGRGHVDGHAVGYLRGGCDTVAAVLRADVERNRERS